MQELGCSAKSCSCIKFKNRVIYSFSFLTHQKLDLSDEFFFLNFATRKSKKSIVWIKVSYDPSLIN